ncbi:hypothetical protein ENHYD8BJ_50117 [Enhydrobacter sp. 8BJ]|nr:hypothetical protein ENHYD8BJ_50117 [Enhydrobacter sp. 8BJ]
MNAQPHRDVQGDFINSENPKLKHIYINSIFAKNESKFTPYAYKQLVIINRS